MKFRDRSRIRIPAQMLLIAAGTFLPCVLTAESESTPASSWTHAEVQVMSFLETYPYGWRAESNGLRAYALTEKDSGFFAGGESVRFIPRPPTILDFARWEIDTRLYQGNPLQPVGPTFLTLPALGGFDPSPSMVTLLRFGNNQRNAASQTLTGAYVGYRLDPLRFDAAASLHFILGIEALAGYRHGSVSYNGIHSDVRSPFAALELPIGLRYDLSERLALTLQLPLRFYWASPITFQRDPEGSRSRGSGVHRGVSLGLRFSL